MDTQDIELASHAARQAASLVRQFTTATLDVKTKANRADLVTRADRAAEDCIRQILLQAHPDDAVFGEENGEQGSGLRRWLVDPIDGTLNFVSGIPYYCISIALEVDQVLSVGVIYDPERDELFTACRDAGASLNGQPLRVSPVQALRDAVLVTGFSYREDPLEVEQTMAPVVDAVKNCRGVRRMGAAALDLAWVAAGRFEAFWEARLNPWDVAAGSLIVREAGGTVSNGLNQPYRLGDDVIIASNGGVHQELVEILSGRS